MITLAKKNTAQSRIQATAYLMVCMLCKRIDICFILYQDAGLVPKLFDEMAVRYATRPGGYTRVLKAGFRQNDKAPMAFIEYVDNTLPKVTLTAEEHGMRWFSWCPLHSYSYFEFAAALEARLNASSKAKAKQ